MLRTRLYLGLLPLLLLFVAVGLATIHNARGLAQAMQDRLAENYRWMIGCHEMSEEAALMTQAVHGARLGRELEARKDYDLHRGAFQKLLMEQSFSSAATPRAAEVAKVADAFDRLTAIGEGVFTNGGAGATRDSYQETERVLFGVLSALKDLTRYDYEQLTSATARAAQNVRRGINLLLFALAGGILLSLFLSYRLARSLLRPVEALTASAAALGEGNWDRDVPVTSGDELGELARTFNTMAAKLRAYRDATNARVVRTQRTMEATLTSTPDPLFVVDRDGRHEVRNPAAEKLAAMPEFAHGFPGELDLRLREVLSSGNHYTPTGYKQVVTLRVGGDDRHYLPRILAVGDALTGFGGAAVILQDVTKFRLLDDAKSNLVGTVSHELKTPLTSLRLAVYLLLEQQVGPLTPAQKDLLETVRDDADRLLRILNDLLDLARIEGGVASLNRRQVAVRTLLEDMAREMKPIVEAAGQRIEIVTDGAPEKIWIDPERLRHVFINLLSNASKYSPDHGVITLAAEAGSDGYVRFSVRDRGAGIPAENLPYVFEKFYRVPGQTKKGAGIGLTIARQIVIAHRGTIACSSRPGEGSEFHFRIPVGVAAMDDAETGGAAISPSAE